MPNNVVGYRDVGQAPPPLLALHNKTTTSPDDNLSIPQAMGLGTIIFKKLLMDRSNRCQMLTSVTAENDV